MYDELKKATEELENAVQKSKADPNETSNLLAKAVERLTARLSKSRGKKPLAVDDDAEDLIETGGGPKSPVQRDGEKAYDADGDGRNDEEGKQSEETDVTQGDEKGVYVSGQKRNPKAGATDLEDTDVTGGKERGTYVSGNLRRSQDEGTDYQEAFYKSLIESEGGDNFAEVVEASAAMEHLTDTVAKSVAELRVNDDAIGQALTALIKSQIELNEKVEKLLGRPQGQVNPGVYFSGHGAVSTGNTKVITKSELQSRLQPLVESGKVSASTLASLDSRGVTGVIGMLPDDVKRELGL